MRDRARSFAEYARFLRACPVAWAMPQWAVRASPSGHPGGIGALQTDKTPRMHRLQQPSALVDTSANLRVRVIADCDGSITLLETSRQGSL